MTTKTEHEPIESEIFFDKQVQQPVWVDIQSIMFDRSIILTLENNNINCSSLQEIISNTIPCQLQRLEQMQLAIKQNITLPYVVLKKHTTKKIISRLSYVPKSLRSKIAQKVIPEIPEKITYSIIDGRHRIVCSILYKTPRIKAIIVN
jgi:methyl coenzyme M reductase subunit D